MSEIPPLDSLVRLLPLTTISDARGDLGVAEVKQLCGFSAERFYFLYGGLGARGGHAHRRLRQLMISLAGQVEITVDSGREKKTYILDSRKNGLEINPVVWRDIVLSPDAVLGVLASEPYDESEYIRDYETFRDVVSLHN